jgi:6-pyruvoyl-tetrahydropterin synthase
MASLFVDHLTVIDFAYFCPEKGVVGESLILDVELFGHLNEEGMLFDFSHVKKRIKLFVDELVDHKLLIPKKDPLVSITMNPTSSYELQLHLQQKNNRLIHHLSPKNSVCLIDTLTIDAHSIGAFIQKAILSILPNNVTKTVIQLRNEKIETAFFHYVHGLKKHFGDCQRIAHGHRSKINVWVNNEYSIKWSEYVANRWKNIYLVSLDNIKKSIRIKKTDYWVIQYVASQGAFQLMMPQEQCYIIKTETTIELIALYLTSYLKTQLNSSDSIKVCVYEGVDKGACASE